MRLGWHHCDSFRRSVAMMPLNQGALMSVQVISPRGQLIQLFQTQRILTLKQLRQATGRSRRTLFRDLSQLVSLSSYSHAGKYYTLESIAQFNSDGLWFFQGVGFSQHHTLKRTLVNHISESLTGYTHKELNHLFRIRVHDTLRRLTQSAAIQRHTLANNIYVYLSTNDQHAKKQLHQRISMQEILPNHLPTIESRIEILAETLRHYLNVNVTAEILLPALQHRGVLVTREDIDAVWVLYDIKKNKLGRGAINSKTD